MDICARTQKTVVFITHDVYEAVLLSDRVVVMSDRPGTIVADVKIPFARPRGPSLRSDTLLQRTLFELARSPDAGIGKAMIKTEASEDNLVFLKLANAASMRLEQSK